MIKIMKYLIPITAFLLLPQIQAAMITNGNFADSCSFDGWHQDTDGVGELPGSDFTVSGTAGDCAGAIHADYQDTQVFFANTLFQELDLTGADNSRFLLTLDFSVDSELTSADPSFIADYFAVGLNDGSGSYFNETGSPGYLAAPADIDGFSAFNLSFELSSAFAGQSGWFLDFQLGIGADINGDSDAGGSTLAINRVSLTEIAAEVPEPGALLLFMLAVAGLSGFRRVAS
ncbi:PEP-CTERM sorting domain-containing protein [Thalassomonas viridans]|uniref:PEP-CTERM sorting domain-containing protein n=1 Tax=Thalassomonas viridans TaxID=137584 RepID=A0AAF0C9E7_9GAMM|nr:PEP-CTERM sorting domain-containing protein [Thalassomonas viridans]WDE07422.1 PEP-CTERM sorting domain-containing protein [Thalassomonas viridans]